MDAVDPGQADKSTAAIEVQIKLADDNETYKLPQSYQVPPCSPIFQEPSAVLQFAYQMGPSIMWLNDSLVRSVLPGHSYRVRYVLYNQAKEQVAASNWSQSFQTRDSAMGQWPGMTGKVLALFLGAAGVLVCLLLLIYCFYSRSHRKEMFSHRRLYEGGFEDPGQAACTSLSTAGAGVTGDTATPGEAQTPPGVDWLGIPSHAGPHQDLHLKHQGDDTKSKLHRRKEGCINSRRSQVGWSTGHNAFTERNFGLIEQSTINVLL
nr:Golgi-associated olfactory signaling regulator isoform X3 [Geotrypetes seraphini]